MSNLFNSLGNQPQNPMQMIEQIKNDPVGYLKSMGYNIPNGIDTRNPQAMINSLIQSGQIPGNRYQQAMQMMQKMGRR